MVADELDTADVLVAVDEPVEPMTVALVLLVEPTVVIFALLDAVPTMLVLLGADAVVEELLKLELATVEELLELELTAVEELLELELATLEELLELELAELLAAAGAGGPANPARSKMLNASGPPHVSVALLSQGVLHVEPAMGAPEPAMALPQKH